MAMLAEPRRKQRWTLNPRGKLWSEDSNKFGQKMLEKMGWSSGKGLGANEQGMTEHIRVPFKNDSAGIGYKQDAMESAWTGHQDGFNELLKELQKSQDSKESVTLDVPTDSLSGKSLELKSKQSRARVHYQKFTRGKDVNKYSSKDLANIFGQKDMKEWKDTKEEMTHANDKEDDSIAAEEKQNGVMIINRGSASDYFKNKASSFHKIPETIIPNNSVDSEEEPTFAGLGFSSSQNKNQSDNKDQSSAAAYGFVNPCLKLDSPEDISSPSKKLKCSKKRRSKSKFYDEEPSLEDHSKNSMEDPNVDHDYTNGIVNPALNITIEPEEVCNGQEYEVSRAQFGMTNSAFDPEDETSNKRRVTFNDHVEYSTDPVKKKTGKARLDKFEIDNKKCKRKRKHEESTNYSLTNGIVNEALNIDDKPLEEQDNEINEIKCKKTKRRRESRPSILETIIEIPEEDKRTDAEELTAQLNNSADSIVVLYDSNSVENVKRKKKKKKDKAKKNEVTVENDVSFQTVEVEPCDTVTVNNQEENEVQIQETSSKIKKKKRKHKYQENAESTSDMTNAEQSPSENCETIPKQKKNKKGKKQEKEEASDEVGKILSSEKEVSDKENTDNGEDQIKEKKKKKRDKRRKSGDKLPENDSPSCMGRIINESKVQEEEEESSPNLQSKPDGTPSKIVSSPWNERPRMSKKLLKSLFHRNAISNFPGSNIYDIKGYGSSLW